jgi:hypothetical protein
MRMARKPSAIARELLRNFPKGGKRRRKRNNRKRKGDAGAEKSLERANNGGAPDGEETEADVEEGVEVDAEECVVDEAGASDRDDDDAGASDEDDDSAVVDA